VKTEKETIKLMSGKDLCISTLNSTIQ